jgi:FAD/FMN-containing dehydrogenase
MVDQLPMFTHTTELITHQCEILQASTHSHDQVDACFALHAELVAFLSNTRGILEQARVRWSAVAHRSDLLDEWWAKRSRAVDGPFHTKELSYFYHAYHLGRLYVHRFACRCHAISPPEPYLANPVAPIKHGQDLADSPPIHMSARIAVECAQDILHGAIVTRDRSIPGFGLAVDFKLSSMPLCAASEYKTFYDTT